jgi:hypothetical protein
MTSAYRPSDEANDLQAGIPIAPKDADNLLDGLAGTVTLARES